ncbi:hypothetical protein NNJEOMEG_03453 [Fundidesulfovibrio magnetotacticus]|uniref:Uncharacterized protein n=1 Tax=Fundidesulfovibrio magnetotacticus TaxID=2730080 RepID=A0A6V8M507_9BACT|nr:hypothetical protein [Fundidesulfovibrio magnetotacticus]GFK95585.1 hypothetical protein NNJEOMEG_03453 [Fundidesulfovibrio magnetotacticus]
MDSPFHALARLFLPEDHELDRSTRCGEKGKSLPICRSDSEDVIIRFKLSEWDVWEQGMRSCDCLFLCKKSKSSRFVLVLAELKGYDTRTAFAQIACTAKTLCKSSSFVSAGHGKAGDTKGIPGHGGRTVAYVVAPGGGKIGGLWQNEARKLKPYNILMQPVHKPGVEITVNELYKIAFDEVP